MRSRAVESIALACEASPRSGRLVPALISDYFQGRSKPSTSGSAHPALDPEHFRSIRRTIMKRKLIAWLVTGCQTVAVMASLYFTRESWGRAAASPFAAIAAWLDPTRADNDHEH